MRLRTRCDFLLTLLLLDLLKANAPSRIICVASKHSGIKINFDDLMLEKKYSVFQAVGQTKLGLILFTKELAKRLEETGVTINSLYPGLVKTNLLKDIPWMRIMFALMPRISPEKGASTSIYLASSPDVENVIGKFFSNKKETPTSSNANNESDIKRLWDISMKLTGLQI